MRVTGDPGTLPATKKSKSLVVPGSHRGCDVKRCAWAIETGLRLIAHCATIVGMKNPDRRFSTRLDRRRAQYERSDGPLHQQPVVQRRRTVTVPPHAGPHVRLVFAEMARQHRTYDSIETASGITRPSIKAWRHRNAPNLASIEAVLNALGLEFHAIPVTEVLPPEVASILAACSAKMKTSMPETFAALVNIAARQMLEREGAAAIIAEHDREREAYRLAKSAKTRHAANDNTPRKRTRKSTASAD